MRVLFTQPESYPATLYPAFLQAGAFDDDALRWLLAAEPYATLNALVLDTRESALLQRLTETFSRAFLRAGQVLSRDVPRLVAMGFPWPAAEILSSERMEPPLVGRFDFARDEDGHWWLLEFNADAPAGLWESAVLERLVCDMVPPARLLERPNQGFGDVLASAFREALVGTAGGPALGLLVGKNQPDDLVQVTFLADLLRSSLQGSGIDIVVGDPAELRLAKARLVLGGRRLDVLYRYVPLEHLFGTTAFAAIYDAAAGGKLRVLNSLAGLLLQHKGVMARLWAHRDDAAFPTEERRVIERHLAPSWPVDDYPRDLDQAELVAKQVFGREGEEVFFGEDETSQRWSVLRQRRTYIVQQRIRTVALDAALPTLSGVQALRAYATVGSFAVRGRWAGYYTRLGEKRITAEAQWLSTVVQR